MPRQISSQQPAPPLPCLCYRVQYGRSGFEGKGGAEKQRDKYKTKLELDVANFVTLANMLAAATQRGTSHNHRLVITSQAATGSTSCGEVQEVKQQSTEWGMTVVRKWMEG